jgi:putative transposase
MELEWLKINLSSSGARERHNLIDHDHPEFSVSRQCALLDLPRSTLYYQPKPVRESTLLIMARIDALYLEDPGSGSRRMVVYLAREGIPIWRSEPHALHRVTGDLPETPQHHSRGSIRALSLPR